MEYKAYKLNDQSFMDDYKHTCLNIPFTESTLFSVTFTLNPKCNSLDILTQYKKMIQCIKYSSIFHHRYNNKKITWSPNYGFQLVYLCPELTEKINIHLHGIMLIRNDQIDIIHNEIKRFVNSSEVVGKQYAFKPVNDTLKDRSKVADYPFKDTDQLLKFPDSKNIYYFSGKNI